MNIACNYIMQDILDKIYQDRDIELAEEIFPQVNDGKLIDVFIEMLHGEVVFKERWLKIIMEVAMRTGNCKVDSNLVLLGCVNGEIQYVKWLTEVGKVNPWN